MYIQDSVGKRKKKAGRSFQPSEVCSTQAMKDTNYTPTELSPSWKSECDTANDRQTAKTAADDIIDMKRSIDATMELYVDDPGDRWPSNEERKR